MLIYDTCFPDISKKEKSIQSYQKALKLTPQKNKLRYNTLTRLASLEKLYNQNYKKAIRIFEKQYFEFPDNNKSLFYISSTYFNDVGNYTKSLEYIDENLKKFPNDFLSKLLKKEILNKMKK